MAGANESGNDIRESRRNVRSFNQDVTKIMCSRLMSFYDTAPFK